MLLEINTKTCFETYMILFEREALHDHKKEVISILINDSAEQFHYKKN